MRSLKAGVRLLLISACFLFTVSIAKAQVIHTLSSSFELTEFRFEESKTSSGSLYYKFGGKLAAHITSPIDQWMIFGTDTLLIYYPDEKKVLKIPTLGGESTLPVFQLLINTTLEDLGLGAAGYKLDETKLSGDTLTAIWNPPSETTKIFGDLIAIYNRDYLQTVLVYNAKDKLLARQVYSDYSTADDIIFPGRLVVTRYDDVDSIVEDISLRDIVFNRQLADSLMNPKIPDDAEIRTLGW